MSDAGPRGRFVWHELLTTDVPAGLSFYGKVVGWKSQGWDVDPSYKMLLAPSGPVGGAMLLPEEAKAMGAPPNWCTYIGTPDVDATAAEAESLGGEILRAPSDIPNMGRFAILRDPQGAVFAIYQSPAGAPAPSDAAAALGEFSWHELATTDIEAGFGFYQRLFGWVKTEAMDMGPELGVYQMFGYGGQPRGGIYVKPASMPAPCHWMPYARVRDAKQAAETIKAAGGTILYGPMEVPGGDWVTMGMDPQGAAFAVHSAAPAAKAAKPAAARPAKAAATKSKPAKKKAAKKKPAKKPAKKKVAKRPAKKKPAKKAAKKKARRPARGKSKPARRKSAKRPAKRAASRSKQRPAKKRPAKKKAAKRGGRRRRGR